MDRDGKLVIIELKRDDSGADVHWQAIKYASYFARATETDIINLLSRHDGISTEDAATKLRQHLGADDLNALNNDQRIILASHRFAPEVTNAVLWLNEKSSKAPGENRITCVKLTPYQDGDALYLQASRLIPVPDTEGLLVGLRDSSGSDVPAIALTFGQRDTSYQYDDITQFLRGVVERAKDGLAYQLRASRFAKKDDGFRSFQVWHNRQPWGQNTIYYKIGLSQVQDGHIGEDVKRWSRHQGIDAENFTHRWMATVYLHVRSPSEALKARLGVLEVDEKGHQDIPDYPRFFNIEIYRVGDALDDAFADTLAATLRRFIEVVTPVVDDFFANEGNEEES